MFDNVFSHIDILKGDLNSALLHSIIFDEKKNEDNNEMKQHNIKESDDTPLYEKKHRYEYVRGYLHD